MSRHNKRTMAERFKQLKETVEYEWGLYHVVKDNHFNTSATAQEVAEAMPDPNVIVRLIRYDPDEGYEDCHVTSDGTFEDGGYFLHGTKVPKRFKDQLQRWVEKYGYEVREVWAIDEE